MIIVAFALPLAALRGCGAETGQTDASATDVAAFIEVLVPEIASSECADLSEAAQEFQANTSGNVDFQNSAEEFQRFAHEAPAEIQDDLQAFADPYSNWAKALAGTGSLDALEARVDRQEMQQATHHIVAWMRMNCR